MVAWVQSLALELPHAMGMAKEGDILPLFKEILSFFFLGPYPRHVEVARLGLNWSCSCGPTP